MRKGTKEEVSSWFGVLCVSYNRARASRIPFLNRSETRAENTNMFRTEDGKI